MPTAQVIKMYNGFYYLQVAGQEELLSCRLRGRIKRNKGAVVTGDYVEYQMLEDGTGVIERCLPRRTLLKRPAVANIDQVLITFAARQPDLNQLLLNRFLVLAEWSGIPEIVICINKCDLLEEKVDFLQDYVQAVGIIANHSITFEQNEDFKNLKTKEYFLTDYFKSQTSIILEIKKVSLMNFLLHKFK